MCNILGSLSLLAIVPLLASGSQLVHAEQQAGSVIRTEHFDKDPGWEGHNNRITTKKPVPVKQDFGYSATNHAGKSAGEMGGAIQRSTKPASYSAALTPAKTLDDKLTASGTFAITACQPSREFSSGSSIRSSPAAAGGPSARSGWILISRAKAGASR